MGLRSPGTLTQPALAHAPLQHEQRQGAGRSVGPNSMAQCPLHSCTPPKPRIPGQGTYNTHDEH